MKKVISLMLTLALALTAFGAMTVSVNADVTTGLYDNFNDLTLKAGAPTGGQVVPANFNNAKFYAASNFFYKLRGANEVNGFEPAGATPSMVDFEGTPERGPATSSITYQGNFSNNALQFVLTIRDYAFKSEIWDQYYTTGDPTETVIYDYNYWVKHFLANNVRIYTGATADNITNKVEVFKFDGESYQGGVNCAVTGHILPANTNFVRIEIANYHWEKMLKSVYITPNTTDLLGADYQPPQTFFDDFTQWTDSTKLAYDASGYAFKTTTTDPINTCFGTSTKYLEGVPAGSADLSLTYQGNYGNNMAEVCVFVDDWFTTSTVAKLYPEVDCWKEWYRLFEMYKSQLEFYAGPTADSMTRVDITNYRGETVPQGGRLAFAVSVASLPADTQFVKFVLKDAYWRDKVQYVKISNVKTQIFGAADYEQEVFTPPATTEITALERSSATTVDYVDITSNRAVGTLVVAAYSQDGKLLGVKLSNVSNYPYFNYVQRVFLGYTLPTGTYRVRAFFVNSLSTVAPLADSI